MNINKINLRTIIYSIFFTTIMGFNVYFSISNTAATDIINEVNNEIKFLNTNPNNSKVFNNKFLKIYIPSGYQLFYNNDTALKLRYNRFLIDFNIFTNPLNIDNYIKEQPDYNNERIYSITYNQTEYKVWFKLISNMITEVNIYNNNLELRAIVPNYMIKTMLLKNIELMKNSSIIAAGEKLLVLDETELSKDKTTSLEENNNNEDANNKDKCEIRREQTIKIS